MSKIRVYELAQKMGIEINELMTRLDAFGVEVKNPFSII
jgi:translation initiation factor IF-2